MREYKNLKKLVNLYNEALHKYLRYESNYHVCKESENYKALNTDIAQQTMKVVDRIFKSFFALIQKAKSGSYKITALF